MGIPNCIKILLITHLEVRYFDIRSINPFAYASKEDTILRIDDKRNSRFLIIINNIDSVKSKIIISKNSVACNL